MKIALVCPYDMFGFMGGVPQVVIHLAEGLEARGHQVRIITPRPSKFDENAPPGYILLGNSRKMKAILATAGDVGIEFDSKEIEDVLEREQFDVINFHEPWLPHLSRQIIQRSTAAHVATFHASLADSMAGKSLLNVTPLYWRAIIDKTHVFTAVSKAASAGLLGKEGDHPIVNKIEYIPNGIDLAKYQKTPRSAIRNKKMKTIFYLGRLEGRKGVNYLLRAYNELSKENDNVQLYIAGKGPDEEKLRNLVRDYEIPRVTFLGFITEAEKIHHLHKADLFCAPAHRGESFGIVLLEAMAAGCPIVAGDNLGYLSVMTGTGAISLVNPKDTVDFSRRLKIMLYDNDLRALWLRWSSNYIKQFDYKNVIDKYENAFKEAIKIHGTKPKAKSRFSFRRQPR